MKEKNPDFLGNIMRSTVRILSIVLLLVAFMLALEFIKVGIGAVSETFKENINRYLNAPLSSLGVGWFTSFLTMNSTSIATLGINFVGHGILQPLEGFFLLIGSRIGSSAIILILGIIFYLKGQSYYRSIYVGLVGFFSILATSLLALFFGRMVELLKIHEFIARSIHSPGRGSLTTWISESLTYNFAQTVSEKIGPVLTFLIGFILIILVIEFLNKVFYIIDFSKQDFEKSPFKKRILKLLHTPIFAFFLGLIITALTLSITISMSILIPIYTQESLRSRLKEIFSPSRRIATRIIIPYALGANIGSFLDTIVLAKISNTFIGLALVYNVILSSILAVILIMLLYRMFSHTITKISDWMLSKPDYLPEIIILLIVFPLLLIFH